MSHWQTGKLDLKCSLNVLKKALINIMPEWEEHMYVDEKGGLSTKYDAGTHNSKEKYELVVSSSKADRSAGLYSDIGFRKNEDDMWDIGGDYSIDSLKKKVTGEVMRMRTLAIAKLRGYEILRNDIGEDENVTEIRINAEDAKTLLA